MTIFCYAVGVLLNLIWILLGDRLSVPIQLAIPVTTVLICALGVKVRTRSMSSGIKAMYRRKALMALFVYYLVIITLMLFFGGLFHIARGYGGTVSLEPFRTVRNFIKHYRRTGSWFSLSNLVGNVIILVPFGVLMPVLFKPMRHAWIFIPTAAIVACGIELIQWLTATGAADVDDSILNLAGALLGYLFTRICQMIQKRWMR